MQRITILTLSILSYCLTSNAQQAVYLDLDGNKIALTKEIVTQKYTNENTFIEMYLPHKPNGAAIMVYPGGYYVSKAIDNEGRGFVNLFNDMGLAVLVVSYELPKGDPTAPMRSVERAMRGIKAHAQEWNIDTTRIGIMGASAGGHLATTQATHFSSDIRPAFQILLYPAIYLDKRLIDQELKVKLFGKYDESYIEKHYASHLNVKDNTPPAFIAVTQDDSLVPVEHSLLYYQALTEKKIPAELHIYPTGGHGFGSNKAFEYHDTFYNDMIHFIKKYTTQQ